MMILSIEDETLGRMKLWQMMLLRNSLSEMLDQSKVLQFRGREREREKEKEQKHEYETMMT